jgi:hypothetical protein
MGKMVGLEKPGFLLLSGHPQSGRVRKVESEDYGKHTLGRGYS